MFVPPVSLAEGFLLRDRDWLVITAYEIRTKLKSRRYIAFKSPRPEPPLSSPGWLLASPRQGLKGELSPRPVNDGLESDTWYQISTVSERGEGVFSEAVYAIVKTHRESARVMEMAVKPAPGSTTSLELWVTLDCSSAPTSEACGLLR